MSELVDLTNVSEENKKVIMEIIKKADKSVPFVPKYGEEYWYLDSCGDRSWTEWEDSDADEWGLSQGNYFRTEAEAEEYKVKLETKAKYCKLAVESWGGEKVDWNNGEKAKWHNTYDYENKGTGIGCDTFIQRRSNNMYFKSTKLAKQAIEEIGEDNFLKYVLEGEE